MKKDHKGTAKDAPVATARMLPRRDIAVAAALAVLTALVFCQVIGFQFLNFDDNRMVTGNQDVQKGLSAAGIWWAGTGFNYGIWMPVTNLTYLVDATLFGKGPAGQHAHSLLWHAGTVALWYLGLVALTGRRWESALAALLFGLHPMRAGAVAPVSGRNELTCAFFFALAVLLYARHAARPSVLRMAAVTAAGALAMMGKSTAMVLPGALLLLDAWPLNRFRRDGTFRWTQALRLVGEKVPLLAMSAVVAVMWQAGQRSLGAMELNRRLWGDTSRLENAVVSCARYLWHTLYPVPLVMHEPVLGPRLTFTWFLCCAAVLVTISVLVYIVRRQGYPAVAWCWFLGALLPVIGIVGFASASMADRYSQIAHMGLFVAVAWGIFAWSRGAAAKAVPVPARTPKGGKRPAAAPRLRPGAIELVCAAVLVTATAAACVWQTAFWHDSERLLARALRVMPDNAVALNGLGMMHLQQGRRDEALEQFREAARSEPDNPLYLMNLGSLLASMDKNDEAIRLMGARVDDFAYAQDYQSKYAALLRGSRGPAEALPYFKRALDLNPGEFGAVDNYVSCLTQLKRFDEARAELQKVPETDANRDRIKKAMDRLNKAESEESQRKAGS